MDIVFIGLSVTSSWGNGHATNYRALLRALTAAGHTVTFLERDVPWYADQRDLKAPPWGRTHLYGSVDELTTAHAEVVREADAVIVGSYVPEGVVVGEWVCRTAGGITVFFDLDTPVTLAKLAAGDEEYLSPDLVRRYDLYLSFTGGPTLERLESEFGAPNARAFYCLVDVDDYYPEQTPPRWDLGYLGTYSEDRQPPLDELLVQPAVHEPSCRFVVAGPQYPDTLRWPANVERIDHLAPPRHRAFYSAQRFTLNVTRAHMVRAGYSPSVRLFEAAACGVPIISDRWNGLDEFFTYGSEILVADTCDDVRGYLHDVDEAQRRAIGLRARDRVLREHTAPARADELIAHLRSIDPARGRELT